VNEFDLTRRGALKYLGILAASAAGREFLLSWLPFAGVEATEGNDFVAIQQMKHGSPETEVVASYSPQFFSPKEFATVDLLAEMILPADDQPGAHAAHVADYIDFIVFSAAEFAPSLQRDWNDGLAGLERRSQEKYEKPFGQAAPEQRLQLLTAMSAPEYDASVQHEGYGFYRLVKDMTVEGFYTSKIGLIDVLDYQGMNYMADFPGCTHPEHQG